MILKPFSLMRAASSGSVYYVRHDGTQTSKFSAVIGGSSGNALSVAGFNASSFEPGDVVVFEDSGAYTSTITPPSSGSAGLPIIYRGPSASSKATLAPSSGPCLSVGNLNYVEVRNFSGSSLGSANVFQVRGDAGSAGAGYTVKMADCDATSNNGDGDGFSQTSGDDYGEVEFIRCKAAAITGPGDQGFTNHMTHQKIKLTDCETTDACAIAIAATGGYCEINGGDFSASTMIVVADECDIIANEASITTSGATTSRLFDVTGACSVIFNDCDLNSVSGGTTASYIRSAGGSVEINGGTLAYNASASFCEMLAAASIKIKRSQISMLRCPARWIRSDVAGTVVEFIGNIVNYAGATATNGRAISVGSTSGTPAEILCTGNVLKNSTASGTSLVEVLANAVANVEISNNTVSNVTGFVLRNLLSTATSTIRMFNNIVHNSDLRNASVGVTSDYNVYYGTTPNEGDTNAGTADPLFADAASGDFTLLPESPYLGNGTKWWGGDAPIDANGVQLSDTPNRGAYQ